MQIYCGCSDQYAAVMTQQEPTSENRARHVDSYGGLCSKEAVASLKIINVIAERVSKGYVHIAASDQKH